MKTRIPLLVVWFLLGSASLRAQSDEAFFRQEAAGASILYRGRQTYAYSIRHNGTFWWASSVFMPGEVFYNGKIYHDLLLNVDAVRQDLVVQSPAGQGGKVLAREFTAWFTLGGRHFVNLNLQSGPQAPPGYWEVLHDGKTLFLRQVTKTLQKDYNGAKQQMIGEGEPYDLRVHETFVRDVAYCLLTETGRLVPVRSKSQIRNQFPALRKEIRRHIVGLEKRFDRSLTLEEYGREVLQFVESR